VNLLPSALHFHELMLRWHLFTAFALTLGPVGRLRHPGRKAAAWIFQPSDRSWSGGASAEGMQDVWIELRLRLTGQPTRLHGLWLAAERPMRRCCCTCTARAGT
jgi:hypothetical protein